MYNCDDQSYLRLSSKAKILESNELYCLLPMLFIMQKYNTLKAPLILALVACVSKRVQLLSVANVIHHDKMKKKKCVVITMS